ncbi:Rv3654c family TadE-like protein [Brachybacterium phenoliresistens]|uniref:Rv3654c family TadE-like protein n=1 Tax=Brachybacterium phenoliresistens TaxID=396014 RepID=UPI0031D256C2
MSAERRGARAAIVSDRGSAPAAVIAWVGMAVTMLGALSLLGLGAAAQARADTAADLAALAGADALAAGSGDPCPIAGEVARRNGAQLASCAVAGRDVIVTVAVDAGALPPVSGRARAGPAPSSGLPR